MAIAAPAQAEEPDCDVRYVGDYAVDVSCDNGRPGNFQVVAHCRTPLAGWTDYGTIGRVRSRASFADCEALLGPVWLEDYHVRWL